MLRLELANHGLNAPFGARCFLTYIDVIDDEVRVTSLNAPFGARCFLTILK